MAVKGRNRDINVVSFVEAMPIHAPGVWVGARLIETFDAAMSAEQMIGGLRSEPIGSERVLTALQDEIAMGHNQVQIAGPRTHRAVAVEHLRPSGGAEAKADRAAMASAAQFDFV